MIRRASQPPDVEARLRAQLLNDLDTASAQAAATDGRVSPDVWVRLSRRARVLELRDTHHVGRGRWLVAGLLLALLVVASILLFTHVNSTDVEVSLRVSGLELTVAEPASGESGAVQPLTETIAGLTRLEVTGIGNAQLLTPGLAEGRTLAVTDDEPSGISVATAQEQSGQVTLAPIAVPRGTVIRLSVNRERRASRMELQLPQRRRLALRADVAGTVLVASPLLYPDGGGQIRLALNSPDSIDLQSAGPAIQLVAATGTRAIELWPHIPVSAVSFVDWRQAVNRTVVQPTSTIAEGTVYLESLNGKAVTLRAGEPLEFEQFTGELRMLTASADRIVASLHGTVGDLRVGSGDRSRSLMPTLLEWLEARQGMALLWGTALYMLTLCTAVLRWWGIRL